jgi:antitoxin component of MazEF toxin-antitoxin module
MKLNRIRRVGNSNVVSLPRELDAAGFAVGVQVVIQQLPSGEVRLLPADRVRQMVRDYGRRVVTENRAALEILANHDRKT